MYQKHAQQLLDFIEKSPSSFHVIENMKKELAAAGFCELKEQEFWNLAAGGAYYVTRNGSALIAFRIPQKADDSSANCFPAKSAVPAFQIAASHSDSPSFKVKEHPETEAEGTYVKLNVEKYGGMILSTWLDRPLSAAGRIVVNCEDADAGGGKKRIRLESHLVNLDRDLLMIPNLAIHMNPDANNGYKYNMKTDMMPVLGTISSEGTKPSLTDLVAAEAEVNPADIIAADLYLYNRQKGTIWGAGGEFLASPKLDDLECAYASLQGILAAGRSAETGGRGSQSENICVHCVLDNEEVGSETKQGAAGTFLADTLKRICTSLGGSEEDYLRAVAGSFLISADNAHAVHPNRGDMADSSNRPKLNGGIVIKYSGSQKYSSDAVSAAILKELCEKAEVPVQIYTNRSDIAGGSTLGNISTTQVSINSVDIGLAQLAMHSSYESAGTEDLTHMIALMKTFFGSTLKIDSDGCELI